jgi:GWxTD domain-containing protein
MPNAPLLARLTRILLSAILAQACAAGRPADPSAPPAVTLASLARAPTDPLDAYRKAGFLVSGEPFSLVGTVHAIASPSPESTLVIVTFSLPTRVLTFTRDGEQYHASYHVTIDLKRDSRVVKRHAGWEVVRVASFRETSRGEESVIFQQYLIVSPGAYTLSLRASDSTSGRYAVTTAGVEVPRYDDGTSAAPIAVYHAEPRLDRRTAPALVPNPRSTVVFGRDSILTLYVESYGARDSTLLPLRVLDQQKRPILSDTVRALRRGDLLTGTVNLQVGRLGLGAIFAELRSENGATALVPLVVSLGEGLGVATFDEMLEYLRYYTTVERLRAMRDTTLDQRPGAWAKFLKETDPTPTTIEHEGLRDYFQRLAEANARFRDEGIPGWLTERGMVYSTLGEPDNVYVPSGPRSIERGRALVWDYARYRAQFVFVDATGFGKWRLAPGSEAEFATIARRVRVQ